MAEQWYAVCEIIGGELISVGTVLPARLDDRLKAIPLLDQPDWSVDDWDKVTKSIIVRAAPPPLKDRVDDIMLEPEFVILTPILRDSYRDAIIRNLPDDVRYY